MGVCFGMLYSLVILWVTLPPPNPLLVKEGSLPPVTYRIRYTPPLTKGRAGRGNIVRVMTIIRRVFPQSNAQTTAPSPQMFADQTIAPHQKFQSIKHLSSLCPKVLVCAPQKWSFGLFLGVCLFEVLTRM